MAGGDVSKTEDTPDDAPVLYVLCCVVTKPHVKTVVAELIHTSMVVH